jgi:hypothetical protein
MGIRQTPSIYRPDSDSFNFQFFNRHDCLDAFCRCAEMKVNANKCVPISQVWPSSAKHRETDLDPFCIHADIGKVEIPMEMVYIYLGMPIGINRYENSKYGS